MSQHRMPPDTSPDVCAILREDAAVAVLRREPLPRAVREHQTRCPPCRDEFARLAVLPQLLDMTRDETVPAAEIPDEALLRRTLAELRLRRQRHRRSVVLGAAAAALVLAFPAGIVVRALSGPDLTGIAAPGVTTPGVVEPGKVLVAQGSAQDATSPVGADVQVLAHGEGRGSIVVVAPWGLAAGTTCRIELVDSGGSTHPVQTWVVPAGYTRGWKAQVPVTVAPREVADIKLVDESTGDVLLTVPVRSV